MAAAPKTDLRELLEELPRIRMQLQRPETIYWGVCILQAKGAWSRVGPTWRTPEGVWITFGPGLHRWGTKRGLAEASVSMEPTPQWHSTGVASSPEPNIVFAVTASIIRHYGMNRLAKQAEELETEFGRPT